MKNNMLFLTLFSLILCSCKNENPKNDAIVIGNLTVSPSNPTSGNSITLNYSGNDSITESIYYYLIENKMFPADVHFSKEKTATISIPDSAQAIAFQFKKEKGYDNNNEQGYIIPVSDKNGSYIPGTKAAMANFYLSYYGKNQGIKKDLDSVLSAIKQDIDSYPELRETWYSIYLSQRYKQNNKTGKVLILDYLNDLRSHENLSEKGYSQAIYLGNTLRDKKRVDSLTEIATSKFPNGDLAKRKYATTFFNEKNPAKQLKIFEEVGHNFTDPYKGFAISTIARRQIKNRDFKTFSKYAEQISDKSSRAGLYNSFAWDLVQKDENLDFAEEISKKSLDLIEEQKEVPSNKPDYLTKSQFKISLQGSYLMYADTYAWILFKQGKVKEAINYQEEVTQKVNIGGNDSQNMKTRYIEFLLADNQYEKAQEKAEEFIKNADASTTMEKHLEKAYIKNNESADGFESYLAKLTAAADDIILNETRKKMLDEIAPEFKLTNLNNEEVALSDLKGKTVILDFWATWCGPCKASFPGMQKAVDKYKDNDNVVFLFVDTRERGTAEEIKKNVQNFISKNKYTFDVLLDTKLKEGGNDYKTVEDYNVGGIPTKIVIGSDGRIKFRSVGYKGSVDGLIKELDLMIELAQS